MFNAKICSFFESESIHIQWICLIKVFSTLQFVSIYIYKNRFGGLSTLELNDQDISAVFAFIYRLKAIKNHICLNMPFDVTTKIQMHEPPFGSVANLMAQEMDTWQFFDIIIQ